MDRQSGEQSYILSFGAGINTVALMVILLDEQAPLDEVVFADTGGETPGTYDSVEVARQYLARCDVPFRVVKARPRSTDLYGTAMRRRVIPFSEVALVHPGFQGEPYSSLLQGTRRAYQSVHWHRLR